MENPRRTNRLSAVDAAYIAGLIDGEGTITLSRRHATDNRQLVISISSTERSILDFVRAALGVGKITRKMTTRSHHRAGLTFSVANRQALALLGQVQPFLLSYKRRRGELVLAEYVRLTPRNGRYTPALRAARSRFEQALLSVTTRVVRPPTHV